MNINAEFQLALKYYQSGNLGRAASVCENLLQKKPRELPALHFLGIVYQQLQNYDAAIKYLRIALQLDPTSFEGFYNLGSALEKKGTLDEAIDCYQKVIQLNPDFADAYIKLGKALQSQRRLDDAISCYQKATKINPNNAGIYFNLGVVLQDKGQLDEAISCYKKALALNLNIAGIYNNLGLAFQSKGQIAEAINCYQNAIKLDPTFADAYNNLGISYQENGQNDEAISCHQRALRLNPKLADAYNNLGCVYKNKGQIDEAEIWFRRAIGIKQDFSTAYSNLLFTMEYNAHHDPRTIYLEHLTFSKKYAEHLASTISPHKNNRNPKRKLKIGYVSPDFKNHPVSCFIEPILITHNREYFEVFCYSNSLRHDEVTKRIQEYADQWRNIVGISDGEVTELIRKDEIDMLVDLAGHTASNRILLFAQKPAPIQISWIGYLATTGLSTMDYKIADIYTDPSGKTEDFYTEKLMRLPESCLCYLPNRDSPEVGPLPALSRGHITFGSFNNFPKVTAEVFALWAKILKELPDSRLILKGKSFRDKTTCQYATSMFTERGIAAERITLQSWDPSPKHLEAYNQLDIGLDTFPFNGAATTCEAMWMGVPVITLAGTAYHSRVGISLLSNVGLSELVGNTSDEYISASVSLAKDFKKLQSLREHLRDRMTYSPLCDAKHFTTNLEMCYRKIWETWCKST